MVDKVIEHQSCVEQPLAEEGKEGSRALPPDFRLTSAPSERASRAKDRCLLHGRHHTGRVGDVGLVAKDEVPVLAEILNAIEFLVLVVAWLDLASQVLVVSEPVREAGQGRLWTAL